MVDGRNRLWDGHHRQGAASGEAPTFDASQRRRDLQRAQRLATQEGHAPQRGDRLGKTHTSWRCVMCVDRTVSVCVNRWKKKKQTSSVPDWQTLLESLSLYILFESQPDFKEKVKG